MTRYRTGNRNARNIYLVDGDEEIHVGVAFTEEDGRLFVQALNAYSKRDETIMNVEGRHPSTVAVTRFFVYDHLPPHLRLVSELCAGLVTDILALLPDDPELTAGLRKLLEAKDCFVRLRATVEE